jgi:uncharacterized membrane protein
MPNKDNIFSDKEILVSILTYFIIGIVWFFVDNRIQDSSFIKFHVKQAIVLFIADLLLSVIIDFIYYIPILGSILSDIAYILMLILVIIGIFNALSSKQKELPLIGKYSSYLKF